MPPIRQLKQKKDLARRHLSRTILRARALRSRIKELEIEIAKLPPEEDKPPTPARFPVDAPRQLRREILSLLAHRGAISSSDLAEHMRVVWTLPNDPEIMRALCRRSLYALKSAERSGLVVGSDRHDPGRFRLWALANCP
jgi:hypothetical protein